jgi:N6-L-threonylcarbamoyladenine synthase
MKILAIETSCDDTGIALLECSGGLKKPQFEVLKNLVSSQVKVHQPYHGVVPNLAKREHIKNLPLLFKKLSPKPFTLNPDYIAVTVGPGLEPALWTGINFAENLAKELNKPLIGVNHLEGHIYSNWLKPAGKLPITNYQLPKFPAIVLMVSGGHTILLKMNSLTKWEKLGETLDDAAGEAFDKVARMLGLKYPGGPEISKLAEKGNPQAIKFPRPMLNKPNYDFSFSGLKTSVLYYLRDQQKISFSLNPLRSSSDSLALSSPFGRRRSANTTAGHAQTAAGVSGNKRFLADVAASFQQAVVDVLVGKTMRAAKEFKAKSVLLCGGVAANRALRDKLKAQSLKLKANFFAPTMDFNTDNAAMIAAAGYINLLAKKPKLKIEAQGNLNI